MKKIIFSLSSLLVLLPSMVFAAAHSAGSNFKAEDGTIYFKTADGQKRAYTSGGAFLSYGLNSFSKVVSASSEDLNLSQGPFIPPQDGKIICSDRGNDKGTCYLISLGKRAAFTSQETFLGLGFSFGKSLTGDVSFLSPDNNITSKDEAHRPGTLIKLGSSVYLVGPSGLYLATNKTNFNAWGYKTADVVNGNNADKALPKLVNLSGFSKGRLSPFDSTITANLSAPQSLAFSGSNSYTQQPTPTPSPAGYAPPAQTVQTIATSTGAITVSIDGSSPGAQNILMSQTNALVYAVNFAETSGIEAVNLKGLTITATYTGAVNIGGVNANTGFNTFKKFSLINGSTVISRTTWANSLNPSAQTYTIDFMSGLPLNFQIPASGNISLQLKVDLNDWATNAAASKWNFSVAAITDVSLSGQTSQANITPTITNKAVSQTTTVLKQPVYAYPISGVNSPVYTTAYATGTPTTQETMGIFNFKSPSSQSYLTSVTLSQGGSVLPTGTSSAVSYFIYDASVDAVQPIGKGTLNGGAQTTIQLNLNSAVNKGLLVTPEGTSNIIVKADTTNFSSCGVACAPIYSYSLSLSNWQWTDPNFPGQTFTGPYTGDSAKSATYNNNTTTKNY